MRKVHDKLCRIEGRGGYTRFDIEDMITEQNEEKNEALIEVRMDLLDRYPERPTDNEIAWAKRQKGGFNLRSEMEKFYGGGNKKN